MNAIPDAQDLARALKKVDAIEDAIGELIKVNARISDDMQLYRDKLDAAIEDVKRLREQIDKRK